jgi:hypothetical protein
MAEHEVSQLVRDLPPPIHRIGQASRQHDRRTIGTYDELRFGTLDVGLDQLDAEPTGKRFYPEMLDRLNTEPLCQIQGLHPSMLDAVPTVPEPSCKAVQLSGEDPAAKPIVRDHARPTAADQLLFSPAQSCRIMPSTAWSLLRRLPRCWTPSARARRIIRDSVYAAYAALDEQRPMKLVS